MKKTMITLAIAALMPWGMAWGFHEGGGIGGGGNRGGGGGPANAGGGGKDSSTWDDHSKPKDDGGARTDSAPSSGKTWSQGRSSGRSNGNPFRSSGRSNAYINHGRRSGSSYGYNGYNHSGNGLHHFNSYSHSQAFAPNGLANRGFHSNAISPSLRRMGVTRIPQPLSNRAMLPNSFRHSPPRLPGKGPAGRPLTTSAISPRQMSGTMVQSHMAAVIGDKNFMAKVAATTPLSARGNYIWHSWNRVPYVSYWPGYGGCWYGWNIGGGFFWTQFYWGNWWYYDPWWGHWCWWSNGNWWWENPTTTTVYIYENGNYTAANGNNDANGGYSQPSDDQASSQPSDNRDYSDQTVVSDDQPAGSDGAEGGNTLVYKSRDGSRTVKITSEGDAFLYDQAGSPNFLDSNVASVKFSKPGDGPLRILLILKDGSFEIFKADGTPADGTKT